MWVWNLNIRVWNLDVVLDPGCGCLDCECKDVDVEVWILNVDLDPKYKGLDVCPTPECKNLEVGLWILVSILEVGVWIFVSNLEVEVWGGLDPEIEGLNDGCVGLDPTLDFRHRVMHLQCGGWGSSFGSRHWN